MENSIMIKASGVSKEYRLGAIGGTTLREDLQRLGARMRKKEDPTLRIGQKPVENIGEKFLALNGVSFEIKKGEAVGIIGHNGAGKSTLLKLITRVTAPTSGYIGLNGRVASMLEVGTGFHPELTGRENIYMNGAILGMSRKEIDEKIEQIIDFSEVRQFIDTPVKRYSSGMYVKLAFSVAAHLDSEIVIMDEVLAVGDMAFQKKCLDKMRDAATTEGKTVLYVSHNMNTIRQLCDRVIVLEKGSVIFDGGVNEGINQYIKYNAKIQTVNDCSTHYYDNRADQKIHINTVTYLNKDFPAYDKNEPVIIKADYSANFKTNNLAFRAIIKSQDHQIVGMATSKPIVNALPGNNQVTLTLNIDALAPGKYSMKLVAYAVNEFGTNQNLDVVDSACSFEKIQGTENNKMLWDSSWWGHLIFPEITAEEQI